MEDVLKFLAVVGIIIVSFVSQAKKKAKEKANRTPVAPIPSAKNPLPENWGEETYGGYIPEGPQPEALVIPGKKSKSKSAKTKSSAPTKTVDKLSDRISNSSDYTNSPSMTVTQESNDSSEFEIHSAEEARRAIIWSDILQRKY
ncbi:MAG: hypothetical protein LUE99_07805 [Bacteroides sp.]|nr:hypothetical protein [Bacteroides sp.]